MIRERKCPECGNPHIYPTHNIAEELVYVCDPCDINIPWAWFWGDSELDPKGEDKEVNAE